MIADNSNIKKLKMRDELKIGTKPVWLSIEVVKDFNPVEQFLYLNLDEVEKILDAYKRGKLEELLSADNT